MSSRLTPLGYKMIQVMHCACFTYMHIHLRGGQIELQLPFQFRKALAWCSTDDIFPQRKKMYIPRATPCSAGQRWMDGDKHKQTAKNIYTEINDGGNIYTILLQHVL